MVRSRNLPACLFAALLACWPVAARSADVVATWDNSIGNWTDGARWSSAPDYPHNGALTYDAVINAGTVTLNVPVVIEALDLAGGYLLGPSDLTLNGLFTWSGGYLEGAGQIIAGGGIALSGATDKVLHRVLTNSGTAVWTGDGYIRKTIGVAGGEFNNLLGAVFDAQNDSRWTYSVTPAGIINNAGTFKKSAGAGATRIDWTLNNSGSVQVLSGRLNLNGGGASSGPYSAAAGTTLEFSGGTHELSAGATVSGDGAVEFSGGAVNLHAAYNVGGGTNFSGGVVHFGGSVAGVSSNLAIASGGAYFDWDPITFSTVNLSGGALGGVRDITVTGLTTWTGGTLEEGGSIATGGGMAVSGLLDKFLHRVLNNSGTVTWTGTGFIHSTTSSAGGRFNNLATGVFDMQEDCRMTYSVAAGAKFSNAGLFKKSGGSGTGQVDWIFDNTGTVQVQSGRLKLTGGGTSSGPFSVDPGAVLEFASGLFELHAGASIGGGGGVVFSSGEVNLHDDYSATGGATFSGATVRFYGPAGGLGGSLTMSGGAVYFNHDPMAFATMQISAGTLGGSADVSVSTTFNWSGGMIEDGGDVSAGGTTAISGAAHKYLDGTLINTGTIDWSGAGLIRSSTNVTTGLIDNRPFATFNMQNDGRMSYSVTPGSTFLNAGTFFKSAGTGTARIDWVFDNSGFVEVQSGTLLLAGGGTHTGDFVANSGATLLFGGGTHELNLGTMLDDLSDIFFSGGVSNFNYDPGTACTVRGSGSGQVVFNVDADLGGIDAGGNSRAVLPAGTGRTVVVRSLTIAKNTGGNYTGRVDVNDNILRIHYGAGASPMSEVAAMIASGYKGGAWNGGGLMSTVCQTTANALGFADGADGVVAGLLPGNILITYVLPGDVNMDGVVDGTDVDFLLGYFNVSSGARWTEADLTYDGAVNGDDVDLFLGYFGSSGPLTGGAPSAAPPPSQPVPEPATALLAALGGAAVAAAKRRRGGRAVQRGINR